MSEKSLSDYMKMIQDIEQEYDDEQESKSSDSQNLYVDDDSDIKIVNVVDDPTELKIKKNGEGKQVSKCPESDDKDALEESQSIDFQQMLESGSYWDNGVEFIEDMKYYSKNLSTELIEENCPIQDITCNGYRIIGSSFHEGLIVVAHCFDNEHREKSLLFYVKDKPVFIQEVQA